MKILDLYSGLGGASEAFVKAGWDVVRIENNPVLEAVPHTIIADVLKISNIYHELPYYDLIWASPPCREFSTAYAAPRSKAARAGEEYAPDMRLLRKAVEIIDITKPRYWIIENVSGASKIFSEELGMKPKQIIGSFFLWGNFPQIIMPPGWSHSKYDNDTGSSDPLRANKRGKIPLELSTAVLEAITQTKTLEDFCA